MQDSAGRAHSERRAGTGSGSALRKARRYRSGNHPSARWFPLSRSLIPRSQPLGLQTSTGPVATYPPVTNRNLLAGHILSGYRTAAKPVGRSDGWWFNRPTWSSRCPGRL